MIPVSMEKKIAADCQSLKEQGLWGLRRILTGKQRPRAILDGRNTTIVTSTNYLGLAADQEIVAETVAAVQSHGVGDFRAKDMWGYRYPSEIGRSYCLISPD